MPRITNIVNSREIWIVFTVNPDGAEYDISGGKFHYWRKNRQPTPGTTSIGTDLNRNYSYHWGGGGRTSSNPAAITYRGTERLLDARGARDARLPGQPRRQRPAADPGRHHVPRERPARDVAVRLHDDQRPGRHDRRRTIPRWPTIGKHMAATNGYKPEQASDLYISSGTSRDYQYGVYRIFAYTFEMSVKDYPDDSMIASETGRNKESVLYLMERAACPLAVLGAAVRIARCGAFDDDLEVTRGWTVNPDGTDTAPANARFARANPASTTSAGPKQLGTVPLGRQGVRDRRGCGRLGLRPTTSMGGRSIRSPGDRSAGRRRASA